MPAIGDWTKDKQKEKEKEIKQTILDMHLACHTQQAIADAVDMSVQFVNDRIVEFSANDEYVDGGIFANFISAPLCAFKCLILLNFSNVSTR